METEVKTGQCTNLKAVLSNEVFGSNDYTLTVTGTIKAGPEKIAYVLKDTESPDMNPSIIGLEIYPKPTEGDIDQPITYEGKKFKGLPTISEVRIDDGTKSCNLIIDVHIN